MFKGKKAAGSIPFALILMAVHGIIMVAITFMQEAFL